MVRVRLMTREWNADHSARLPVVLSELTVDEGKVLVDQAGLYLLEIAVVDPESGKRLTSDEDPERWATLLPTEFRAGDIWAEFEETPVMAGAAHGRSRER